MIGQSGYKAMQGKEKKQDGFHFSKLFWKWIYAHYHFPRLGDNDQFEVSG